MKNKFLSGARLATTCMIYTKPDPRFDLVMSSLLRVGSITITAACSVFLTCSPESFAPNARLLIIDLDDFPDKTPVVDTLMEFRKVRPSTLVCLVSDAFSGIDIGSDRLIICDGSVSKTLLPLNVDLLVRILQDNNSMWRDRLAGIEASREVVDRSCW